MRVEVFIGTSAVKEIERFSVKGNKSRDSAFARKREQKLPQVVNIVSSCNCQITGY